jgi:hypothetical protein
VYGFSKNDNGVYGYANKYGVYGEANRNGVCGIAANDYGVYGYAGRNYGVRGEANSYGVYGRANHTHGVYGHSDYDYGVYGFAKNSKGIAGYAVNDYGGHFGAGSKNAIYSDGNIIITDNGNYGMYWSNGSLKAFTIDHPLDPENKVLRHFSTEGPEALVIYTGTVTLDENGSAEVKLPDYFDALARNPRIQLTPWNAAMPDLHVTGIENTRLFIAGGVPGNRVDWQVTAERDDPKARLERVSRPVEEEKGHPGLPAPGEYISPDAYEK